PHHFTSPRRWPTQNQTILRRMLSPPQDARHADPSSRLRRIDRPVIVKVANLQGWSKTWIHNEEFIHVAFGSKASTLFTRPSHVTHCLFIAYHGDEQVEYTSPPIRPGHDRMIDQRGHLLLIRRWAPAKE